MNVTIRMTRGLWDEVHADLDRRHPFATERVGFLYMEAGTLPDLGVLLLPTRWEPVRDEHYIDDPRVAATIGAAAFRQVLQSIRRAPMTVLHVHRHEHRGRPEFSITDRDSMGQFVPGFFNACRSRPHGALVLSRECATGAVWSNSAMTPKSVTRFELVGRPMAAW